MTITVLKHPTKADWLLCKQCALVTVGKETTTAPSDAWKHRILKARHSPIRTLEFLFRLEGIPYCTSVHLCRHIHATPFVRSQRNDRQSAYDRNAARQDAPVDMYWHMNAEELMTIANKRLCRLADDTTRAVIQQLCDAVLDTNPEFSGLLVPQCKYSKCNEFSPCSEGEQK